MAPTVTRSQPKRASLGCGGTGTSSPGCASKISINCKMLSNQYGPTFLKNAVESTVLMLIQTCLACHKPNMSIDSRRIKHKMFYKCYSESSCHFRYYNNLTWRPISGDKGKRKREGSVLCVVLFRVGFWNWNHVPSCSL